MILVEVSALATEKWSANEANQWTIGLKAVANSSNLTIMQKHLHNEVDYNYRTKSLVIAGDIL